MAQHFNQAVCGIRASDDLAGCAGRLWDAVVVGAGMGGSAAAWALARAGWSVLVLERGPDHRRNPAAIRGVMVDEPMPGTDAGWLADAGRDPDELILDDGRHRFAHHPFIGAGTGGSSAIYGAALERFRREDAEPRRHHPGAPGSDLPERWPFAFDELERWYALAEDRLGVVGGAALAADRLDDLSPSNRVLAGHLIGKGLAVERLRLGDRDDGGRGATQGMLCPTGRKHDAARAFLHPAIDDYGTVLLDRCRVRRLCARGGMVTGVVAERDGSVQLIRTRRVLLAGGALRTPALLLASAGLGNSSGWVGRGLMRHFIDLWAVRTGTGAGQLGRKELACNHWYLRDGAKLGQIQSFGQLPSAASLTRSLQVNAHEDGRHALARLLGAAAPVVRRALGLAIGGCEILATIIEDLPYRDNRVLVEPGGAIAVRYRLAADAQARIAAMRGHMRRTLAGLPARMIPAAEDLRRLAHACGTCRAGDDPATSVVDRWCHSHDIANLSIVDASWMPSSGGTNPGLTIAANALRIADRLVGRSWAELSRADDPVPAETPLQHVGGPA